MAAPLPSLAGEGGDVEGALGLGFEGAGFVFEVDGAFEFVGEDLFGGEFAEDGGDAEVLYVYADGLGGGAEAGYDGVFVGQALADVVAVEVEFVGAAVHGDGSLPAV